MLINLRNALMADKKSPLPSGARWVEYLESTGTQYIDIDSSIVATATRYACRGVYTAFSNQALMWSHAYRGVRQYGGKLGFITGRYASTQTSVRYNVDCITEFNASISKGVVYSTDGTELANVDIGLASASGVLRLFAPSPSAAGYIASSSRIKAMKVYDAAGNILFDGAPIAIGTTGYMLDLVSGEYLPYGNKGTGDFVIGPDIPSPV